MFSLHGKYWAEKNMYLQFGINWVIIATSGTQEQRFYADTAETSAGPVGTVDNKLESVQTSVDLSLGYTL